MIIGVRIYAKPGVVGTATAFHRPPDQDLYQGYNDYKGNPPNPRLLNLTDSAEAQEFAAFGVPDAPPQIPPNFSQQAETLWAPLFSGPFGTWSQARFDNKTDAFLNQEAYNYLVYSEIWLALAVNHIQACLHPQLAPTDFSTPKALVSGGTTTILFPECYGINIVISDRGPFVNDWYKEADLGDFGWVSAKYDDNSYGPLQWINFLRTRLILPQG